MQTTISEDIEATVKLLSHPLMRNLLKRHLVESFIFSQGLAPRRLLGHIARLIPLLLVLLSVILVLEACFVLDLHVDRIVHHALASHTK